MNILYVEHYENHKIPTTHFLEHQDHKVDVYVPGESLYKNFAEKSFPDEAGLVTLAKNYDACILNCETFTLLGSGHGELFSSYLDALLASDYKKRIVITTTLPISDTYYLIPQDTRVRVCEKPFRFNTLEEALK